MLLFVRRRVRLPSLAWGGATLSRGVIRLRAGAGVRSGFFDSFMSFSFSFPCTITLPLSGIPLGLVLTLLYTDRPVSILYLLLILPVSRALDDYRHSGVRIYPFPRSLGVLAHACLPTTLPTCTMYIKALYTPLTRKHRIVCTHRILAYVHNPSRLVAL